MSTSDDSKSTKTEKGKSAPPGRALESRVIIADMKEDLQMTAIEYAKEAILKHSNEKSNGEMLVAKDLAKQFNLIGDGGGWSCICGMNFGSFVTHETGCFIYFRVGKLTILLFKNGDGLPAIADDNKPSDDKVGS